MEQVLPEDDMVSSMKKPSKRRGVVLKRKLWERPGRRRNFVQENIAFLRQLQATLREKNNDVTAVVRTRRKPQNQKSSRSSKIGASQGTRKQHSQTGKHSARKAKNSPKFQPPTIDDNVKKIDIELTAEEKLLLKGYAPHKSQSACDLLSNLSSTDNEQDIVEATAEDVTGVVKTSLKSEEIKSHTSLERKVPETVRARSSSKATTSIKQSSTTSPSGDNVTESSAHHTFSLTKQPSIKMTAKAMAAKQKQLAPMTPNPLKAPPSYKRGVVPRYLRTQKKEQQKEEEEELFYSQQGYVPLPNETRKEVLTLLRKSFADLAHQLNMLPLRPPNLEIRERRTDIEKQLNKLGEAIQVFSQPDVSVKVALHRKSEKSV